jgi:hypothetical protein
LILQLVTTLQSALPQLELPDNTCVLRIATTRPTFLLFVGDHVSPRYVVHIGPSKEVQDLNNHLTKLFACVPSLIPKPIAVVEWNSGASFHIQNGFEGLPWFTLQSRLSNRLEEWMRLRDRALKALHTLHAAMSTDPDLCVSVHPGAEMRRELDKFRAFSDSFPSCPFDLIDEAACSLDTLGTLRWPWQHGDFCLNNLLFTDNELRIIDFEEFHRTAVPLQDELTLAQSFYDLMPDREAAIDLIDHVDYCIAPTLSRASALSAHVRSLLIYNLLWRINQSQNRISRAEIRHTLLLRLESVLKNSEQWIFPSGHHNAERRSREIR